MARHANSSYNAGVQGEDFAATFGPEGCRKHLQKFASLFVSKEQAVLANRLQPRYEQSRETARVRRLELSDADLKPAAVLLSGIGSVPLEARRGSYAGRAVTAVLFQDRGRQIERRIGQRMSSIGYPFRTPWQPPNIPVRVRDSPA